MLQRSLSQHTLLQHAGAILKAREAGYGHYRSTLSISSQRTVSSTDDSSTSTPCGTPWPTEKRHIHFNNEVSQCIAVEAKEVEEEDEQDNWLVTFEDDTFMHDTISVEQVYPEVPGVGGFTRNGCSENKTIAPLPSTTLKYRGDTPPPTAGSFLNRWYNSYSSSPLSRSPSIETLRPSPPQPTFAAHEDEDPSVMDWKPQQHQSSNWTNDSDDDLEMDQDFTSGDVMPYEEGEWSENGVLDKMIDAVNTARDIAHVIWNVGWRR